MSDEEEIEPHEKILARAIDAWNRDWLNDARLTDYDIALALEMAIAERKSAIGVAMIPALTSFPTGAFCKSVYDDIMYLAGGFCNFDEETRDWYINYSDGIPNYSEDYIADEEAKHNHPISPVPMKGAIDYSQEATTDWREFANNCKYWLSKFRYVNKSQNSYYTHKTYYGYDSIDGESYYNSEDDYEVGETKWLASNRQQEASSSLEEDWNVSWDFDREMYVKEDYSERRDSHIERYTGLCANNQSCLSASVFIVPMPYYSYPRYSYGYHTTTSASGNIGVLSEFRAELINNKDCVYEEVEETQHRIPSSYGEDEVSYEVIERDFSYDGSRYIESKEERTEDAKVNPSSFRWDENGLNPLIFKEYTRGRLNDTNIKINGFSQAIIIPKETGGEFLPPPQRPNIPPYFFSGHDFGNGEDFKLGVIFDFNHGYSFKAT